MHLHVDRRVWFITGFIGRVYSLWLHFTDHYYTQTSVFSHAAWWWLLTLDIPLCFSAHVLAGWRPSHTNLIFWPLTSDVSSQTELNRLTSVNLQLQLSIIKWLLSHSGVPLYALGTDHTENTASNSSSTDQPPECPGHHLMHRWIGMLSIWGLNERKP
jgi:hypothetical protein